MNTLIKNQAKAWLQVIAVIVLVPTVLALVGFVVSYSANYNVSTAAAYDTLVVDTLVVDTLVVVDSVTTKYNTGYIYEADPKYFYNNNVYIKFNVDIRTHVFVIIVPQATVWYSDNTKEKNHNSYLAHQCAIISRVDLKMYKGLYTNDSIFDLTHFTFKLLGQEFICDDPDGNC
jgi:hypothetical protein